MSPPFISSPLLLLLMVGSVLSEECGRGGFESNWAAGDPWEYRYDAYFDSSSYSGDHGPWMRGSFIADTTTTHTMYAESETFKTSCCSRVQLWLGGEGWYCEADVRCSITKPMTKDFRYSIDFRSAKQHYWIRIWLDVQAQSQARKRVNYQCAETCQKNGCRNMSLFQDFLCKPPPTASRSRSPTPTRTRSPTPSPTRSRSRSPSPTRSATPSITATVSQTPSPTRTRSITISRSRTPSISGDPAAHLSSVLNGTATYQTPALVFVIVVIAAIVVLVVYRRCTRKRDVDGPIQMSGEMEEEPLDDRLDT
jgi:hypothetical protein